MGPIGIAENAAVDAVGREIARMKVRASNGLRHLSGHEFTPVAVTPRTLVWSYDTTSVHRYDAAPGGSAGPLLIVHSLVTRSHVFDLQPGSSLVEDLCAAGYDVYLLDWGVPGAPQSTNSLETYCDQLLPLAVHAVLHDTQRDEVDVLGYCLGAVFAALSAAGNTDVPVRSLVMLAPPIDFSHLGVVANLLGEGRIDPKGLLDETGNVPSSMLVASFRMAQPTTDITIAANYWQALLDERRLGAHLSILGWSGTHIPFPGVTFRQIVELFLRRGVLATGVVPLQGGDVHLEDLGARVLCVTGSRDFLVPPESSAPLEDALRRSPERRGRFADLGVDRFTVDAGHAGLFVGRTARKQSVPHIVEWLRSAAERSWPWQ